MDCFTRFLTRLRAFWVGSPAAPLHQRGRLLRVAGFLRIRAINICLILLALFLALPRRPPCGSTGQAFARGATFMAAPSSVFAGCSLRLEQCSLSLGASLACNVALVTVILRQWCGAGRASAVSRGDQPTVVEPARIEYLEAAPRVILADRPRYPRARRA